MTRDDMKFNLTRWGQIVALIGGLLVLVTALRTYGDERYALKSDVHRLEGKLDRVLDVACDGRRETVRACSP